MAPINLQPAHLQNNLVSLQPVGTNDFERLYAVAADPQIWEQHPQKDRYKREVFQAFFDSAIKSKGAFLVLDAKTGAVIGSSRYYEYNKEEKSIAIGYTFLAKAYWGGPYNKGLKMLMLTHAFTFADAVLFHVGIHNFRSQKAIEKLGAQKRFMHLVDRSGTPSFEYILLKGAPVFGENL